MNGLEVARQQADIFPSFMFGGHDSDRNVFDSVHVLSLPGFTWIDVDSAADQRRAAMACAVVGQRQMLTVGGTDLAQRGSSLWTTPDSFPQGLGIFDMTDLRWKSSFDASARAYESPQSVKDWYERGYVLHFPSTTRISADNIQPT